LILFSSLVIQNAASRVDPESNRIRVIFMGEIKPQSFPFPAWIEYDPKFTLKGVPCDLEWFHEDQAKKAIRLYLPRTYEILVEDFDAVIFEDFTPRVLPGGTLDMFQRAIREEGLGIVLVEYVFWQQNLNNIEMWIASDFFRVLPAEPTIGHTTNNGRVFYEVLMEKPIFSVPDVSKWPMNVAQHAVMIPKDGASTHAIWKGTRGPAVVSRDFGEGKALQIAHGWDNIPFRTVRLYRFLPDIIYNEIFFVANVEPPEDVFVVHGIRTSLINLNERKKSGIALIDFVDRFGADTSKIEKALLRLNEMIDLIEEEYILSQYSEAMELISRTDSEFADFEQDVVDLKENALMWIYIIEWVTVTAVFMITLQALWTLMVRRRLYREVGVTRGDR
jgi:hypothetical protein